MKKVTMYTGDPCSFCEAAKALLKSKNVEIDFFLPCNFFIFSYPSSFVTWNVVALSCLGQILFVIEEDNGIQNALNPECAAPPTSNNKVDAL